MRMTDSLTGDPELDASVPHWPRALPEITWMPLSATKVLAAGSLNATLLPSKLGNTSLLGLLRKLDGKSTLGNLIGEKDSARQNTRQMLRLLYQAGLLEDGSDTTIPEGSAFYALTMDQTRLHRNRKDALVNSQRPIRILGVNPSMERVLKQIGINSDAKTSSVSPAFQLLMLDPDGQPISKEEFLLDVPVLPIRLHGNSIDIGPWLSVKGGSMLSDLQDHIAQEASGCASAGDTELLEMLCAHTISLILAGVSPIVMASTLYRISVKTAGPQVEAIAVSRIANQLPYATPELRKRLLDRAKSAMPPLRHIGTKSYEVHYSPRNLMATFEIQESGFDPVATLPGPWLNVSSRILKLFSSVFGYTVLDNGQRHRNCPTGGNLGSPEPLLWTITMDFFQVYRYIPLMDHFECVLATPVENKKIDEMGVICVGNREKMCRKYGPLGEDLVRLDGGVAKAFFQTSAKVECIRLQHLLPEVEVPVPLSQIVAEREYHYVPLWAFKLQPSPDWQAMIPDKIARRVQFSNIIGARRSVRIFEQAGVTSERYAQIVHASRPETGSDLEKMFASFITPILRVREKENQRFYVIDDNGLLRHLCPEKNTPELFLQRVLDDAPFALFMTVDLVSFLSRRQEQDLDTLVSICGQWLGGLWLSISSNGLGGCPCGAAVEMDLQAALPSNYRNYSILASFVAGRPAS